MCFAGRTAEMYAAPAFAAPLPIGSWVVRQSHQIINTGMVKSRQSNQRPTGDIQSPALIAGIGRLRDVEQLRQTALGQVSIFPEVPQTPVHGSLPLPNFPVLFHFRICENCILIFIRKSHKMEREHWARGKGDHIAQKRERRPPGLAGLGGHPAAGGLLSRGPGLSAFGVSQL